MRIAAALALLLGGASTAAAQTVAPPDPATITLPDLTPSRDPGVIENGWKHFYFHKTGVSYEQAYADFADCHRFLPFAYASGALPAFAPWNEKPGARDVRPVSNHGLVGGLILAMVSGPLERRSRQARMRRCMEPRGYVRYAIAENSWKRLVDDYSPGSIAAQALAASRPKPDQEPVTR